MTAYSKNGKRIGRPPKEQAPDTNEAVAKALSAFAARYDAAGRGRRFAGWNPPATGPNRAIAGLETIRNRTRDSARNDWASRSAVQKWSTALVGIGITPRFKRLKGKRRLEIIDLWDDFAQVSDADGVLNIYGQQTLVVKAWADGGECFARRRARFDDEGFPVPMQVQLLESDMLPLLDADQYQGLPRNHIIRSGIELNKRGRRIAYWFYKEHPGDAVGAQNIGADALVRVMASEVAHIYEPERPGQLRGVSMLAPVLARLRNTADYEDATLERQKIANLFVAFVRSTLPKIDPNDPNYDALTGQAFEEAGDLAPLLPLKPGLIQELEDGQDVSFANPPEAGTNYSDYMRTSHLGTAAGAGVPYEVMSGDIKEVSDRTLRVIINEFRRLAEQRQWQMVIPQFCQKVVNWFADAAVLAGKASLSEVDDIRRVEHAPHGWAYIHPVQDVQGKKMEVESGFRSRASVIGERGDDPEAVDAERASDQAREKDLGLWVDPLAPFGGAQNPDDEKEDGDDDAIDDNEYSAPPNPSMLQQREMARIDAEIALLVERRNSVVAERERAAQPDPLREQLTALLESDGEDQ